MNNFEIIAVTLNAGLLAIFYTILGGIVSFLFYQVFDEFNDDWKKRSILFKITDVSVEVAIVGIISFWSSYIIKNLSSIIPVRKELDLLVDGYISGIFFVFAIFLFIDSLTDKIKFLYEDYLGEEAASIFPQYGSIIDLSLSYTPPKRTGDDNLIIDSNVYS
jgi:hypothetical protein